MSKSNCISLNKGDIVPRDGVLYTPGRHEDVENVLAAIQAMSENIKVDSSSTKTFLNKTGNERAVSSSLPEEEAMIE
jgi:hypothetical protein